MLKRWVLKGFLKCDLWERPHIKWRDAAEISGWEQTEQDAMSRVVEEKTEEGIWLRKTSIYKENPLNWKGEKNIFFPQKLSIIFFNKKKN